MVHSVFHPGFRTGDTAFVDYNVAKLYSSLSFQAAVDGTSDQATKVRIEVVLDGRPTKIVDVAFGNPIPVTVTIAGALRMRISLIRLDRGGDAATVGMGEATLARS